MNPHPAGSAALMEIFAKAAAVFSGVLACASFGADIRIPVSGGEVPRRPPDWSVPTGAEEFDADPPRPVRELEVDAADFGAGSGSDCAGALNRAIAECKRLGASRLVLPRGRYFAFGDAPIVLDGMKDFTLDGRGSTIVFRKRRSNNITVKNCERVKICNLNVDWDWDSDPLASVVEVVGKSLSEGGEAYVDFKFLEYDDFPNKGASMICTSPYDVEAGCVGGGNGAHNWFDNAGGKSVRGKVEWLSGNVARVHYNSRAAWGSRAGIGAYSVGMKLRMQHYYYHMDNMHMAGNRHLRLENFNVYSCAGHAFFVEGEQKYTQFLNVNIRRPPGAKRRAITCTADHLHFKNSLGHFKMENCEFSLGGDDCANFHDVSALARKISDSALEIKRGYCSEGDEVELRNLDFSPANFRAKVVRAGRGEKSDIVEFGRKLPDGGEYIVFNRKYGTRNIIVRNCKFWGNRARGLIIGASDVTVDGCEFYHIEFGAVRIVTGCRPGLWSEGYGAENIVVKNCRMESSAITRADDGDVLISSYPEKTAYTIIKNVLFKNNKFIDSFGAVAKISSCDNVAFEGNEFVGKSARERERGDRGAFSVTLSSRVRIVGNKFSGAFPRGCAVFADPVSAKSVVAAGNYAPEGR